MIIKPKPKKFYRLPSPAIHVKAGGGGGGTIVAGFNPVPLQSSATFSNSNKTVAVVTDNLVVQSLASVSTRKRYLEFAFNGVSFSSGVNFNVGDITNNIWTFWANDTTVGLNAGFGFVFLGNADNYDPPDIVRMVFDPDPTTPQVWFNTIGGLSTWNANPSADPDTGIGGFQCPVISTYYFNMFYGNGSLGAGGTLNVGDAAFAGVMPSSCIPWGTP